MPALQILPMMNTLVARCAYFGHEPGQSLTSAHYAIAHQSPLCSFGIYLTSEEAFHATPESIQSGRSRRLWYHAV